MIRSTYRNLCRITAAGHKVQSHSTTGFVLTQNPLFLIVDTACVENEHWVLAQFDARNGAALQTLINEHKVPVVRFPDAVLDALKPLADEVVMEEAAKTPMATKVNDAFMKFQKEVGTLGLISEKAYYNGIMPKFSLKA